jgi:integrase
MFWAPLIARFQGMRMEEILQLGPEDFGTDKGIPYIEIRHTIVNGLKTLSSARRLLRLKFQVQHPGPFGHRMLGWTDEASTSAARSAA